MDINRYMELLDRAEKLKNNTRHSWTSSGRHESVAEHSWRLAFMAYFMKDEFPDVDINKVILMCMMHDLGKHLQEIFQHLTRLLMTRIQKKM